MKLKFVSADMFFEEYAYLAGEQRIAANEFLASADAESEISFSCAGGCIILRYFDTDEGYFFSAPYALSESFDLGEAYGAISEYCRTEEIPEIIVDVLGEELTLALRGAPEYEAYENEEGTYTVRVYKPTELCDELPEVLSGEVYLGEFADKYADDYEKLIKNVNLNRYFGYNLTDDIPDGTGIDYIEAVRDDFEKSRSMTFAATVLSDKGENIFVGEGALYGFDGRGAARVSFRVLPEHHCKGYGTSILEGLIAIARELSLTCLIGEVMIENSASIALMSRFAEGERNKDIITYKIDL